MFEMLEIRSPKRGGRAKTEWEGFFPYYAGYPESFATGILKSANLPPSAIVSDPWNGSGTTTYSASMLGKASRGLDINPVMVVVARARLLAPSEADSIQPMANEILRHANPGTIHVTENEPLCVWFDDGTSTRIRAIEQSIRRLLLGGMTITPKGANFDKLSGFAATFYVALFNLCRELVIPFRSTNPTWLRRPKNGEDRISVTWRELSDRLASNLKGMAWALVERAHLFPIEHGQAEIKLGDTTTAEVAAESVDFVLTSPPYCTRIDYTAATRIELAVLAPLSKQSPEQLGRCMIGSTRVPKAEIEILPRWGSRCTKFLEAVRQHPSKASDSYYYRTHLDYFDKMDRSLARLAADLKPEGSAVLVVQDSYYKEIHNDVAAAITDMGEAHGLELGRREDFALRRSMSGINPSTRRYQRSPGAIESVLCFHKKA